MKTKKIKLIALMITLAAVLTGLNAEAQKREYRSDRSDNNRGKRYQAETRSRVDKREYKKADHNYRLGENDHKAKKYHKKDRDYAYKHNDHHDSYRYYDRHQNYRYQHPKYGIVYRKFNKAPLRLRHAHGDYYYYGGHYYSYLHGIGYVRVELPRHLVFATLPVQCQVYRVGPHVYYRSGDLVFERCEHGYRLAPSVGIQISAHF